MKYINILEEEIKNKVTRDFFSKFDCTKILEKIDFAVKAPHNPLKEENSSSLPLGEGWDGDSSYLLLAEGCDFQNVNLIFIINDKNQLPHPRGSWITDKNMIEVSIYYAVRHCIEATWLIDRDQFLFPNDGWKTDLEFQNDCLTYTLFNNNIQSKYGINHWIPFTEYQVAASEKFESNFMTDFINGKTTFKNTFAEPDLFYHSKHFGGGSGGGGYDFPKVIKREFSVIAKNVFKAGKELWKYYLSQPDCNVNASLYEIR